MIAAEPATPVAVNVTCNAPAVAVSVLGPAVAPSVQPPTVAIPLAFVVAVPSVTLPPPVVAVNVTVAPDTGLLFASLTSTAGIVATADPAVADCASPAFLLIAAIGPTVAVAVNVTVSEPAVAVSELGPTVVPRIQLATLAMPLASVVAVAPETLPPPLATLNVTLTPATGLLFASFNSTEGATATAVPFMALCASPALLVRLVGAPA